MTKKTLGTMSGHKKLSSFGFIFPHDDDTAVNNISGIYDDILEFSRSVDLHTTSAKQPSMIRFISGLVLILSP